MLNPVVVLEFVECRVSPVALWTGELFVVNSLNVELEAERGVEPDLAILGRGAEGARFGGGVVNKLLMLLQHPKHAEPLAAVSAQVLVCLVGMLGQEVVPEVALLLELEATLLALVAFNC